MAAFRPGTARLWRLVQRRNMWQGSVMGPNGIGSSRGDGLRRLGGSLVAVLAVATIQAAPAAAHATSSHRALGAVDRATGSAVMARSHIPVVAHKRLGPSGGLLRLRHAAIYVPPGVIQRRGRVTITQLPGGRIDFHISAPWGGNVAVTLPRVGHRRVVGHNIDGTWLPEGRPGQRTVWVSQLSLFDDIKAKAKAAVCFLSFSKSAIVRCLAEKLGTAVTKKVALWIADKLGASCSATLAASGAFGAPSILISAFTDPACRGSAGETGFSYPDGPSTVPVVTNNGGSQTQAVNPQGPTVSPQPSTPVPQPTPPAVPASSPPPPPPPSSPPPPQTWAETTGGAANSWTNYTNAGGVQGPTIPAFATVQIACKVTGFRVQDGNTWWYRIASSPWNNSYYVSADAFYNNGQTSGSLHGTPFVDPAVANC
jgi:hypothetical protein